MDAARKRQGGFYPEVQPGEREELCMIGGIGASGITTAHIKHIDRPTEPVSFTLDQLKFQRPAEPVV